MLKLIRQWLGAGVLEDGVRNATEIGSPQGGVISPLLANIYLHVLDMYWAERYSALGKLVRYADDFVITQDVLSAPEATTLEDLKEIRMAASTRDYNGNGNTKEGMAAELAGVREMLYTAMKAYANEVPKKAIDLAIQASQAIGRGLFSVDIKERQGKMYVIEVNDNPSLESGEDGCYPDIYHKIVKRLLDTGVSLQQIRTAVAHLRERGVDDLAQITLMSDGASVYECTSADEVIDLVQGGQGVFGIAVGRVWREVEGSLASLPSERAEDEAVLVDGEDELSVRRRARNAG